MVEFDERPYIYCEPHLQVLLSYLLPKSKGNSLILEFPYQVHYFFNDWILKRSELKKFHILHNNARYTLYKGIVQFSKSGKGLKGQMRIELVTSIESYVIGVK